MLTLEILQEIVSAGGDTVWGDPAEIGKVLEGNSESSHLKD